MNNEMIKKFEEELNSKPYLLNTIRFKNFKDKILVTADCGTWIIITKDKFNDLINGNIDLSSNLFKELESKLIIVTKQNIPQILGYYQSKYDFLNRGATLHIIAVTKRCDMGCVYCHVSATGPKRPGFDMNFETAKKTVDFIFQSPSKYLTIEFQGGETLLNFKTIKYTVEYAEKLNSTRNRELKFAIVTNLNNLTDEILDYLKEHKFGLCTSLDGHREVHDFNRKKLDGTSNYDVISKWSKKIRDKGFRLNALPTITRNSLKYPKELVHEYLSKGIVELHIRPALSMGRAKVRQIGVSTNLGYSVDEFIEFWKQVLDEVIKVNLTGTFMMERNTFLILKKILTPTDPNYTEMRNPCGAIIGQIAYNFNGEIFTCDDGRGTNNNIFKLGTVNQTYKEIVTSKKSCGIVLASMNDNHVCTQCAWKPYCGLCPVYAYSSQNSIIPHVPSFDFCKLNKKFFQHVFEKYHESEEIKKIFKFWIFGKDKH